jgi:hypothetical protein
MNSPFLASAMLRMEGCRVDSFRSLSQTPSPEARPSGTVSSPLAWLTGLLGGKRQKAQ